jgi:hypothetical protein
VKDKPGRNCNKKLHALCDMACAKATRCIVLASSM